jgi:hypothetical protein
VPAVEHFTRLIGQRAASGVAGRDSRVHYGGMTLDWHRMKPGYYVAAGKRFIYELSQDNSGQSSWWAVLKRPYLDGEGTYDAMNVSYWPAQTLEEAKQEADLNDLILDDAPAT